MKFIYGKYIRLFDYMTDRVLFIFNFTYLGNHTYY